MAVKSKVKYRCADCGFVTPRKLHGDCPECGAFQKFVEIVEGDSVDSGKAGLKNNGAVSPVRRASSVNELVDKPLERIATGIGELDRVLGGGFVGGEVVMLTASPGSGKSTLSMGVSDVFARMGKKVLYVSGEESEQQLGLRARRMNVTSDLIRIVNETTIENVLGHVQNESPDFLVIDSLQTMASNNITGTMGSISQSKEAASTFTMLAKNQNIITILISQVTKDNGSELNFAGSNQIAHIVDCILYLESDSETPLKFLRSTKNRFGDVTEVGVFQHSESGLEEVSDPSGILMDEVEGDRLPGTACAFISEGVRQIPVEVQSLVTTTDLPNARKQFTGVNYNRGQIICAILDKFCRAKLYNHDTFVNTVSGLKVVDPLADLAIAAAILSSSRDKAFVDRVAFVGELSLTGQVRGGFMIDNKIREAERLGFDRIVLPAVSKKNIHGKNYKIKLDFVSNVRDIDNLLR